MTSKDLCLLFLYAESSRNLQIKLKNEITKSSINKIIGFMIEKVSYYVKLKF